MSLEKNLEKLKAHAEEALEGIVKKDNITAAEMETAEKAVCILNTIKKIQNADMMMNGGYSGNSYRMYPLMYPESEMSYERGRSPITGRYISRDSGNGSNVTNRSYEGYSARRYYDGGNTNGNYSGHSKREGMIETLNEMMANAQTEQERQYIQTWLRRIDNQY